MLTAEQITQLLRPINSKRVNKDAKGFSHLEAYDVRAHLIRVFGFGGWSQRVLAMEFIYETTGENDKKQPIVSVCYRAHVELTVAGAVYSEWAMGSAKNFPARQTDEAHDFAMKTAESQALKRAAVNLGDQFGLSLYAKGSTNAIVVKSLVVASILKAADDSDVVAAEIDAVLDGHIEEIPAEDTPADEPRTVSAPVEPVAADRKQRVADGIRERLIEGPLDMKPSEWLSDLMREAGVNGVLSVRVGDENGVNTPLRDLIAQKMKQVSAA